MSDNLRPDPPLREVLETSDPAIETLLKSIPGWAWETDANHRFTYFSPECERHSGQTTENIGKSRIDNMRGMVEHSEAARRHIDDILNQRPFDNFVYRQNYRAGKTSWVSTSGKPRYDSRGRFLGYQGVALLIDPLMEGANLSLESERELLQRNAELERHMAQRTRDLAETNQLLDEVVSGMSQGLLVISPGDFEDQIIELCNAHTAEMLMLPTALLQPGLPIAPAFMIMEARGDFAGEKYTRVRDRAEAAKRGESLQLTRVLPNGRAIQGHATPRANGGMILTYTDITELMQQQTNLTEAHALVQEVLEGMEQGLVVYDGATPENQHIVMSNQQAAEILEISPDDASPGVSLPQFVNACAQSGGFEAGPGALIDRLDQGYADRSEISNYRVLNSGRAVRARGKWRGTGGLIVTFTDVTDLRDRERELEEAREVAEQANVAKSAFLANMSHELRTPMNGILGMAQVLAETGLTDEQRLCVSTIERSSDALLQIVNDILDFSKIEAGKLEVHDDPIDLDAVIHDAAALLAPTAAAKGIELCVDIDPEMTLARIGDAGRVRQILLNLSGNAVKFTETGHVMIRAMAGATPDDLTIEVRDTGIGIPEDKLDSIFEAFEQVDTAATRKFTGTGLGLAIARRLAQLMGGGIEVASHEGTGSTFAVRLCLRCDPERPARAASVDLAGRHVLVAITAPGARAILIRDLESRGALVSLADRGSTLMSLLTDAPAVIFSDIALPDMDGPALLERLDTDPGIRAAPVIFVSPMVQSMALTQLTGPLFGGILFKPIRHDQLDDLLKRVLGGGTRGAQKSAPAAAAGSQAPLAGCRILVAEDNRTNQLVIRKFLEPLGAILTMCGDGQMAIDTYIRDGADLILMDVSMPVKSGLEASGDIRAWEADHGRPPVPIVALTANAMPQDRQRCLDAGMDDFATKPVNKKDLVARIQALWAPPAEIAS